VSLKWKFVSFTKKDFPAQLRWAQRVIKAQSKIFFSIKPPFKKHIFRRAFKSYTNEVRSLTSTEPGNKDHFFLKVTIFGIGFASSFVTLLKKRGKAK